MQYEFIIRYVLSSTNRIADLPPDYIHAEDNPREICRTLNRLRKQKNMELPRLRFAQNVGDGYEYIFTADSGLVAFARKVQNV